MFLEKSSQNRSDHSVFTAADLCVPHCLVSISHLSLSLFVLFMLTLLLRDTDQGSGYIDTNSSTLKLR